MKRRALIVSILICLIVVALAAFYASSYPDGLERVAETVGFAAVATDEAHIKGPLPGYSFLPIKSPFWSTFVAGAIGILVVFLIFWATGKLLKRIK